MTLVVDASIAGKWLVEEQGSIAAAGVLQHDGDLIAPDFIIADVCSVLWKKHRQGEISEDHATEALKSLPLFFAELVDCRALSERALEIAMTLDHAVYDCFYLALAESRNLPLITADQRLLACLSKSDLAGLATGPDEIG